MIRHVLLDADGVLQYLPGGFLAALEPYLGDRAGEFLAAAAVDEQPCLRGDGDFRSSLGDHLERYGVPHPVAEVYPAIWHRIEVEPASVDLVHALRESGLGVHLATNQEAGRASYMKRELAYDDLFDESFYSCDLGAAKPESAFFAAAVDRLGATAPQVLFVDDHAPNVDAAREVGLAAEQWHIADGFDRLHALLSGHGIVLH
ncbi:MAG TPA: HAD-IA family hydrolase [Nocardioides sp.]|nr:HAD-IA family hydrolase [Nocardioides sp.]